MTEVKLSPDGTTINVFVPMAWRRRGGRKVIVAPPGCDDWVPPPKFDRALVKALARAHRWRRLLEEGRFGTLPSWRTPSGSAAPMSAASCV
jgi:hypothetical protein